MLLDSPRSDAVERLSITNIVAHEKAHGTTEVGSGNGSISFLSRGVPDLQLYPLVPPVRGLYLEVDSHSRDKRLAKAVIAVSEEKRCFAHCRVSNQEKLEHEVPLVSAGCDAIARRHGGSVRIDKRFISKPRTMRFAGMTLSLTVAISFSP